MQYMGGKYKIAKELAGVISTFNPRVYWEPFVGAGNVIQYVNAPFKIGSDIDIHVVSYLQRVRDGWLPPNEITEEQWKFYRDYQPKNSEEYALKAAVGYGCSFGGRFFEGYARDPRSDRNFAKTVRNYSVKQAPLLNGIDFRNHGYCENVPDGVDLIYCDPPYSNLNHGGRGTNFKHFDTDLFWQWCQCLATAGVTVLVSEFTAPNFALEIWSKDKNTDLRKGEGKKVMTERLFAVRP